MEPACENLIARAEHQLHVPAGLLQAVALTESGRLDPETGKLGAWPWTIASGTNFSYYAPDKPTAIATVERLLAAGRRNIDVGCMQVNLKHHPDAFSNMAEAFDPARNVDYGAGFLAALRDETGSWDRAVERYHSADPVLGPEYRQVVFARWNKLNGGETMMAAAEMRQPDILRPSPVGAPRSGLFAWIAPAWRSVALSAGQSLWSNGRTKPLLLRGSHRETGPGTRS
jgi:hypothetical protein